MFTSPVSPGHCPPTLPQALMAASPGASAMLPTPQQPGVPFQRTVMCMASGGGRRGGR